MKLPCDNCGALVEEHLLDAKPASLAGHPADWPDLERCSGEDFIALECKACYGPAWCEGERE